MGMFGNSWSGNWKPFPKKQDCIIWHQHVGGNYAEDVHGVMAKFQKELRIEQHTPGDPIPDRDNAFAYQLASGLYYPEGHAGYGSAPRWEIDADTLSPMTYYGTKGPGSTVIDTDGVEHELEPGDTLVVVKKGEITVTHSPKPKNGYDY
jgi:hypothetical protein